MQRKDNPDVTPLEPSDIGTVIEYDTWSMLSHCYTVKLCRTGLVGLKKYSFRRIHANDIQRKNNPAINLSIIKSVSISCIVHGAYV